MWAISNQTPFAADRCFVRDRDGAEIWIVAVRGTFDILPDGRVEVAKEQVPVALAPEWTGEPGKSSLRWDTDMVRTKPGTDVIVHGVAHAPGGRPARQVEVGFGVGTLTKRLLVVGDRIFVDKLLSTKPSDPQPFVTMPITYERAYGGQLFDAETQALRSQVDVNPVGCGLRRKAGDRCPNVEHVPQGSVSGKAAGFGAIASNWQPRLASAGTYDAKWEQTRQPLVPEDFRDDYFQSAPPDQRVSGHLRGGEPVVLMNLAPEPLMRFSLPRVRLGFSTRIDGGSTPHRANLHTVILEPEARRLIMVWHTALPCHHTLYTLKGTTVFQKEWQSTPEPEAALGQAGGGLR